MSTKPLPAVQPKHVLDFISHSAAQTIRIGQRLGEQLCHGDVVLLMGDIGVGKTQLVKGIAQGLHSTDLVTSPSFVLINEYVAGTTHGRVPIYHVDLYRLEQTAELTTIGLDELWQDDGICLIEWAERAETHVPTKHLAIYLQYLDETKRVMRFEPHGERYHTVVEQFKHTAFA